MQLKTELTFPVVCFLNGKLSVHKEQSFDLLGARFLDETTFVTLENRSRKAKDGWILDSNGVYISLVPEGNLREWARPFAFLWNAVLTKYKAEIRGQVSVGYIHESLKSLPKSSSNELSRDFIKFLEKFDSNTMITGVMLNDWPI